MLQARNIVVALADHVISEEQPAKEERLICAKKTVNVSQAAIMDAFAGISG